MGENLISILLAAGIDRTKSKIKIQKDLDELAKSLKLNLTADYSTLNKTTQSLKQQTIEVDKQSEMYIKLWKAQEQAEKRKKQSEAKQQKAINKELAEKEKILQYEQKIRMTIDKQNIKAAEKTKQLDLQLIKLKEQAKANLKIVQVFGKKDQVNTARNLSNQIQNTTVSMLKENDAAKKTSISLQELARSTKTTSKSTMSFTKMLKTGARAFGAWQIITEAFFHLKRSVVSGIETIIEMNNALKTLQITMKASSEDLQYLVVSAQNFSKELGTTVQNVLEVAKVYANMNESVDSIFKKTKASLILSNLSGLDVTSSTDSLQAMQNQFDLTDESAMTLVDTITKISANMAYDFGSGINEITKAIQVSGASAKEAGFNIAQYEAIIGDLIQTTRLSGSTLGAGLRQIMARIGRATEPDVTAEDVSKAEQAYKKLGIALRDIEGEFRDMPDILSNLHDEWNGLNSVQRSFIAEVSAGTRRKDMFIQMMNGWENSTKLYEQALDSVNFALQKQEEHMNSIEGKTQRLKATFATMWQHTVSSDTIKNIVDLGTAFINLVDKIGLVETGIIGLTAYLTIFKGVTVSVMGQSLGLWFLDLAGSIGVAEGAALSLAPAINKIAPFAIIAGIYGLIKGIDALVYTMEEATKKVEQNTYKTQQNIDKIDELKRSFTALKEEADKLGGVSKLTTEKQEQLAEVQNELNTKFGDTTDSINAQNKSLQDNIEIINNISKNQAKEWVALNKTEIEKAKEWLERTTAKIEVPTVFTEEGKALQKLKQVAKDYKDFFQDKGFNVGLYGDIENAQYSKLKDTLLELLNSKEKLSEETRENAIIAYEFFRDNINHANQIIDKEQYYQSILDGTVKKKQEINDLDELNFKTQEQLDAIFSQSSETVNNLSSEIKSLSDIYKDLNNGEQLSIDTLFELLQKYPEYTQLIIDANSSKEAGITLAKTLFEVERENTLATLEMKKEELEAEKQIYNIQRERMLNNQLESGLISSRIFEIKMGEPLAFDETQLNALRAQIALIRNMTFDDISIKTSSSSSSSKADTLTHIDDTYLEIEEKLEGINYQLERQKLISENTEGQTKLQALQNINNLYTDQQQALIDLNTAREKEIASLKQSISGFVQFDESGRNIIRVFKDLTDKENEQVKKYQDLTDAVNKTEQQINSLTYTMQNNAKTILNFNQQRLDNFKEVEDKIIQIIEKREELERKELEKTYNEDMEKLEERHRNKLNYYKKELDEFRNMINDKKDALQDQYDEEDYQEGLNKLHTEESDIQKQINILSLRDDVEAKSKTIELEKQLAEKRTEIEKFQRERSRQLQLDNLDDQLQAKERHYDKLERKENNYYEDKKARLKKEYEDDKEYLDKKYSNESKYFEAQRALMDDQIEYIDGKKYKLSVAYNKFKNEFSDGMSYLGGQIKSEFIDKIEDAIDMVNELRSASSKLTGKKSSKSSRPSEFKRMSASEYDRYLSNKKDWEDGINREQAEDENADLREKYKIKEDRHSYDELVGSYDVGTTYVPRTGKAIVHKGEAIIPKENNPFTNLDALKLQGFMQKSLTSLNFKMPQFKIPQVAASGGNVTYHFDSLIGNVEGNLDTSVLPKIDKMIDRKLEQHDLERLRSARAKGLYRDR